MTRTNTHELDTQLDFMIYCTLSLIIHIMKLYSIILQQVYTIMLILENALFSRLDSAEIIANINPL